MTLPAEITSRRLRLPLVTRAEAEAMRAGRRDPGWHPAFPGPDDVDAASMACDGVTWGPRLIVYDGQVVGTIGPFGPPKDGEVEVGYGLVEAARGRGLASEALRALLAATDAAGVRVRAGVRPDNGASLKVLARCGFTELRGSDDDGAMVLARRLPAEGRR
jgi:RimJ/RimL family protein N-acetyltransferase